jgi:pyruvate kinase
LQKQIVSKARAAGKPVVVATQMLESMISSPVPTRAEVSDVATAVFDGADAVMLSAESAVGKYPIEAIRTMDRIAIEAEKDPSYGALLHATRTLPQATAADAIAAAAHTIADTLKLAAIICYTATGSTALRVARERPGLPVIALSPVLATARKLAAVWGMHCVLTGDPENQAAMVRKACRIAFDEGFAKAGEGVIIVAGVPLGSPGTTNMVRIAHLDDAGNPGGRGDVGRADGRVRRDPLSAHLRMAERGVTGSLACGRTEPLQPRHPTVPRSNPTTVRGRQLRSRR